jgi:hypothetical protein
MENTLTRDEQASTGNISRSHVNTFRNSGFELSHDPCMFCTLPPSDMMVHSRVTVDSEKSDCVPLGFIFILRLEDCVVLDDEGSIQIFPSIFKSQLTPTGSASSTKLFYGFHTGHV